MAKHITYYLKKLKQSLIDRGTEPEIQIKSLPKLNNKIWGIQRGKLYLITAYTSNAKSSFVLQIAMDIASQGHPVLLLSLEMETLSILERALSQDQLIDNQDLLHGKILMYEDRFEKFSKRMEDCELVIDDVIGKTWAEIDKHISDLSVKPKVVIIDHINEVKSTSVQERAMMDEYTRKFKEMLIRHNFAGILCAQINRSFQSEEDKIPKLHHIKGTAYLAEACDIGIILHYPYKMKLSKDINQFDVFIDKNRNGRTGHIKLYFQPEVYRFYDLVEEKEAESIPQKIVSVKEIIIPEEVSRVANLFDGKPTGWEE